MPKRLNPANDKRHQSSAPYTAKIIKAGALIGDTKTLLSEWDLSTSAADNTDRIQSNNVFGKASRSRVKDILAIFRQRYMAEEPVTRSLVTLVRGKFPVAALDRIFYFHSARADRLLYDAVTEILVPMHESGLVEINGQEFQRSLAKWVAEGKTSGPWSVPTITRIAQPHDHQASLRDARVGTHRLRHEVDRGAGDARQGIRAGRSQSFQ